MAQLSINEVARLALDAGWSGSAAAIATAIAMAESGGRTDARGDTTIQTAKWGPSIGLWQIRSLKAEKGTGGLRDEIANLDPATNAKHAYIISEGGKNWRPWSVYTSGAYLRYLAQAQAAVGNPAASVSGVGASAGGVGSAFNPFGDLMNPGLWARLGAYILGAVLILFALYRLTGIGDVVVSTAKSAVKARTGVSL